MNESYSLFSGNASLYFVGIPVGCGVSFGENGSAFRLILRHFQAAGRIVADKEFLHPGFLGNSGGLEGGGMVPLGTLVLEFLQIGGLVIEDRGPLEPFGFLGERRGVGAIGVAPGDEGLVGGLGGRDDAAIGPHHILSALEGAYFGEREPILFDGFLIYIIGRLFLFKAEAEGFDSVVQRESLDPDALGFQHRFRLLHFERRIADLKPDSVSVIAQEEFEHRAEGRRSKDIERRLASLHAQGAEQAEETEHVVSVDVGDKEGVQFHHGNVMLHHAVLDAFAAVNKEQAPVHLQCLGALVPAPYGHGRCRAQ